jgi:hypothetical protein
MAINEDYLLFIHDQLAGIGDFESKKCLVALAFSRMALCLV